MRKNTAASVAHALFGAVARVFPDNKGASATLIAIVLPALIGLGALGAETGVWYFIKLQNQSAADAAAISAAYEVIAGRTDVARELTPAANEAAAQNGSRGTIPTVTYPYSDGIVTGGIAVSLQQSQGNFLAAMFLPEITVTTKAVAVIETLNNACILALGTNGTGIEVGDFASLDMPNCSAVANSVGSTAIELNSTSSITAATLVTAGETAILGEAIDPGAPPPELTLSSQAMIGAPGVADPYAETLTHAFLTSNIPATRVNRNFWNERATIAPALYERGISFGTRAVIDLTPGVYYVTNGDFSVAPGAIVRGASGVTIILTTTDATGGAVGNLQISPGATITLQAPNSGPFSGLAIVQDSNGLPPGTTYTSSGSSVTGEPAATLSGLVYFPNSSMTFHGNPSTTGPKCLVLVVKMLNMDASSSLDSKGCASAGLINLPTVSTVALAE